MEIYYFSGTGNSLFIVKELKDRFPDAKLIPMVSLLDRENIQSKAEVIGFVFPVHALTIPVAVKRFIKKINLSQSQYIFAIATRFGSVFQGFEKINKVLKKKHKRLDAHFIINMGNNESRHESYISPTEEDILTMEKQALIKLDYIKSILADKKTYLPIDSESTIVISNNSMINLITEKAVLCGMEVSELIGGIQYFYADSKCTGCGICETVCLSQKILMRDCKPVWDKKVFCYMCFACLNFCPQRSVQIKDIPGVPSFTQQNGRYSHPYAVVNDIANQKISSKKDMK